MAENTAPVFIFSNTNRKKRGDIQDEGLSDWHEQLLTTALNDAEKPACHRHHTLAVRWYRGTTLMDGVSLDNEGENDSG